MLERGFNLFHFLFIATDTSNFINKNFYYLEKELASLVNLTVWRKSGHIDYILRNLSTKPDFILLLNDMYQNLSPMIKGLAHTNIPTGIFVNDVHRLTKMRANYISKNKINYIFTVIREQFVQTYPELKHKMEWFPHFVNTKIFKDYGLKKDIPLLMMGAISDYYPLRKEIINTYSNDHRFIYHPHPGYGKLGPTDVKSKLIDERYAKEISRAKIFFTCPSILHYPVTKYFETLACKTLLLAPTFPELENLGFVPGKHFVAIDKNNFKEKAEYYLTNEEKREKIAEQGYHFIRQTHTVKIRAMQLVKSIDRMLQH